MILIMKDKYTMITYRIHFDIHKGDIGMAQTTRERQIPFEITADPDPFYSESNLRYLEKKMADYRAGQLKLSEHELLEE